MRLNEMTSLIAVVRGGVVIMPAHNMITGDFKLSQTLENFCNFLGLNLLLGTRGFLPVS